MPKHRPLRVPFALLLTAGLGFSTPARGQEIAPNDPAQALTDDVATRILGLNSGELHAPAPLAPGSPEKERIDRLRQLLGEGVTAFRKTDGAAALAKFDAARKIEASLPPSNVLLARLCFSVADPSISGLGRGFLERAADQDADSPEPYLMLGQLALIDGRLTEAYVLFEKGGKLVDGPTASGRNAAQRGALLKNAAGGRVSVWEQRQNWERGLAEADEWLKLDPDSPSALYRKGRILFMQGPRNEVQIKRARKIFEEAYQSALSLRSDKKKPAVVPPAELALAELHTADGNLERARDEIVRLTEKRATWQDDRGEGSRVYSTISQWYLGQGDFAKAEHYAAEAMRIDPDGPAQKQLTAVLHYYAGAAEAETELKQLNAEQPDDFNTANFLALVLSDARLADGAPDLEKRQSALRIADRNGRLHPRSPAALATRGWVYFNLGRLKEAAQIFGYFEQQPNLSVSPDTAYFMARSFASLPTGEFPNAARRARSLLELAIRSEGPFRYRADAEQWMQELSAAAPTATPASAR